MSTIVIHRSDIGAEAISKMLAEKDSRIKALEMYYKAEQERANEFETKYYQLLAEVKSLTERINAC